jgi:hypothetical protein
MESAIKFRCLLAKRSAEFAEYKVVVEVPPSNCSVLVAAVLFISPRQIIMGKTNSLSRYFLVGNRRN